MRKLFWFFVVIMLIALLIWLNSLNNYAFWAMIVAAVLVCLIFFLETIAKWFYYTFRSEDKNDQNSVGISEAKEEIPPGFEEYGSKS